MGVSIPIGFSSSLQPDWSNWTNPENIVSIPIGFSSSLQPGESGVHWPIQTCPFQSLSGFQVRCNTTGLLDSQLGILEVSIPIGFSSSLQQWRRKRADVPQVYVSIPIGFSSSLQQIALNIHRQGGKRFQSLSGFQVRCNVFPCSGSLESLIGFNPYRVFKFAATPVARLEFTPIVPVSIPIGFSSSLQHISPARPEGGVEGFQSLSGFQVRCNVKTFVIGLEW